MEMPFAPYILFFSVLSFDASIGIDVEKFR